ncbi:MAG: hypothetical protein EAZ08_05270 [Cytophagales bacterium]|nr:MAG: hypothetical protein EAZ08_05270 [Cytophagales bacterium]
MTARKLVLSVFAILLVGFSYAQTQTPEQKAKAKSDGIIKAIEAMIKNKALVVDKKPAVDPKSLLSAAQKKAITTAYTSFYMGQDSVKMRKDALIKGQGEMKAKADEINAKVSAINALAGKTVETEEEGAKVKAEMDKGNEEVSKMKAELTQMQANLGKDAEALKAYPDELDNRLDGELKKTFNAEQNKYYDEIKAKQKAKKGS